GVGTEAAGDEHTEPGLDRAVGSRSVHRDHADVVEHGLAAVGDAAGEVDLELAGQALRVGVAEEVAEGGLGPRRDVEHLVGARARQVAPLHVAHRSEERRVGKEWRSWWTAEDSKKESYKH